MSLEQKGIFYAIAAFFCYSLASLFIKIAISASEELIVFSRSLIGLLLILPLAIKDRQRLKTQKPVFHIVRSIISIATIYCSTYGIQKLDLVDAILLENTLPFFTPLIVFFWGGHKISRQRLVALIIGFIGVYFILEPELDLFHFAALSSLAAGFLAALSKVCIHQLSKTETKTAILFYFLLISTIVSAYPLYYHWEHVPTVSTWFYLIIIGVLFTLFQFLLTQAYGLAMPNTICGLSNLVIVFSIIWGSLLLGEKIDRNTLIGSITIIITGLYIIRQNKSRAKAT